MDNLSIDNIQMRESKSFDARRYKGFKVKIESIAILDVIDFYNGELDDDGNPGYNANSTQTKKVVEIATEKLPELDEQGLPTTIFTEICVKKRFNLKKEIINGKEDWVIPIHEKGKLYMFMKNMGVKQLSQLKGMFVILGVQADKSQEDKFWLKIME